MSLRTPDEIVNSILVSRGYDDIDARSEYLSEKPQLAYDPFLLPCAEEGADIIFASLKEGEKICIYGDYDVDGLLSCVLMRSFLELAAQSLGVKADVFAYIPSRFEEGYGLNTDAIDSIFEAGARLVITVDCGSVAKKEVEHAKGLNLKMVVTDHHDCDVQLMPDCPVVDPKSPDSRYPFSGLSGCGVTFKMAHTIRQKYFPENEGMRSELNAMLDLVAVATIADVVPLVDENRTLVRYGLAELNRRERPAFSELAKAIGIEGNVSAYDVAFRIAPHINAVGRIEDAAPVVELFCTNDSSKRTEIIKTLIDHNKHRRALQKSAEELCVEAADMLLPTNLFLLVLPEEIHEGIAGIVAGRLKNIYVRPCAVLSRVPEDAAISSGSDQCLLKGSARSIEGVNIIEMLRLHKELFTKLGGHAMAAGFTLPESKLPLLQEALNADMQSLLEKDSSLLEYRPHIDAEILSDEATLELAYALEIFEPTGDNNHRPRIALRDVTITNVRRIGKEGEHLSFTADSLACVLFRASKEDFERIVKGASVSLAGHLTVNRWKNLEAAQLIVDVIL